MSLEIWSFVVDVLSLIATVVLTVAIYWLQRSHEKERGYRGGGKSFSD